MRAALEEYNKSSTSDLVATTVVQQSPDKQDSIVNRKRGATIIGTREYLQPILAGEEGTVPISGKDDGYNSIKMRYLRSLNISIAAPTKDIHVSASAPIPIPIPLRKGDSDSDSDSDNDGANDDDDDLLPDGQSNQRLYDWHARDLAHACAKGQQEQTQGQVRTAP
ncbi:hypothetical protein SAMD00019534_066590 [Acytostelium subglobosum LB1]|uniref:hypothetical protein n=1 Tax=Acytostelium subglobosum LB1 TaxID=1410327 RepID=UPI000645113E|nr:hypothetical protein SAMD00019534_066590 [Acytostelium subglobosum LB1]GAM23484.1 hypothetical protein SAMD00019534_066590 [Acytostelium subglobosum LB1]|eukprot:XP_012753225.1 hypothetical protein SAMD00019534_066590 [Acytostelium subglobosum LB1]